MEFVGPTSCVHVGTLQVAVDLIAERSAGGMVEMFYATLPNVGESSGQSLMSLGHFKSNYSSYFVASN